MTLRHLHRTPAEQAHIPAVVGPRRRPVLALTILLATTCALLFGAPPALSAGREYAGQITGLSSVGGLTFDSAGHLWAVTEQGPVIAEYKPYPSTAQIFEQNASEFFPNGAGLVRGIAEDSANGYLYVSDGAFAAQTIHVLNPPSLVEQWPIPALRQGATFRLAIDNSGGASNGRIYVSYEGEIEAFNPDHSVADFSATEPYIDANKITGYGGGYLAVDGEGNIYFAEQGGHTVAEFAPSGELVRKLELPAGDFGDNGITGIAIDPPNGNLLLGSTPFFVDEFSEAGELLDQITGTPGPGGTTVPFGEMNTFAVNSDGYLYANDRYGGIDIFTPHVLMPKVTYGAPTAVTHTSADLHALVKLNGGSDVVSCHFEYGRKAGEYGLGSFPCSPDPASGPPGSYFSGSTEVSAQLPELTSETTYHYRVVVENKQGGEGTRKGFDQALPLHAVTDVETASATGIENVSATLHGSFTAEENLETKYFFEYGTSTNYTHKEPVPPGVVPGPATPAQPEQVESLIKELVPNTTYHYRFVAENKYGTTPGEDKTLTTFQPPTIESFSSSEVTATSAVLHARINPRGFDTTCHFEYGTTTAYDLSAPCPAEITESLSAGHPVEVELQDLQRGVTYHFRVLAHNRWGTVASEDQSFEFFPPSCPNAAVRQQTGSAYLPDCRAYELVSPGNANATLLYSAGPTSPYATSPSRFTYTGAFSALPEASETIGTDGDLYVATRTDTGWVSHYVGLPGNQTGCMGGPPTNPESYTTHAEKIQDWVFADASLSRVLDFNLGNGADCYLSGNGTSDATQEIDVPSNAPFLWSSAGDLLAHLPTDLESTPGAAAALACRVNTSVGHQHFCSGEVSASPDLTHLLFSSNSLSFAEPGQPPGLTTAPGSAYDDNLATGKLALISTLKGGGDITQDSAYANSEEFLRFPAVSTDGSHVLISTATAVTPWCDRANTKNLCPRFTDTPIHLYMSIDDEPAVEVSRSELTEEDVAVSYVGMTLDGSKIFFTSEQHLTAEDPGHGGASLYMWSQQGEAEGHPLTLISKGQSEVPGAPGNTEDCAPPLVKVTFLNGFGKPEEKEVPWTNKCGVVPYSGWSYANAYGSLGGNGHSDTAIASKNGDVYFYSPEQLDGDRGVLNQQNLYDYREGRVQYVTTLTPGKYCSAEGFSGHEGNCTEGPIARLQVTPDDTHMAFVTADRLTSFENAGHLEMYSYTPATGALLCDSCNPDGKPATADVHASQNGLFLTEDGRTFFSTTESLVPQDTDKGVDVYEFVDGRPQLITPGTGTASITGQSYVAFEEQPGLIGVSANGTDVYFSTYDSLISEDHNGDFLKFYDARTNGGFPQPPPTQPCAAAEECHGPGTEAPQLPTQGTAAILAGGNSTPESHSKHHKKKHKKAKHKRHHTRAVKNHRGGNK